MIQQIKEEARRKLWDRFKSPLGRSSIDNKNNSMFDLEAFIDRVIDKSYEEGRKDLAKEILSHDYYDCTYGEMYKIIIEKLKLVTQ